jgi:hypothetical protein
MPAEEAHLLKMLSTIIEAVPLNAKFSTISTCFIVGLIQKSVGLDNT